MRPPKVKATTAFIDRTGKLKCAGPLSAFERNPFAHPQWPEFRVSFNHQWFTCRMVDAHQDYGWVAESVESLNAALDVSPKVELRR